jgi:hypothetical protein
MGVEVLPMLRRSLLGFLILSLLVQPAGATWSIVVVDRRTGEVAVGAATCIARINLATGLATLVPGVGAGVVQASGSSADLVPMTQGLRRRLLPADILELVQDAEPTPRVLQTGIVSFYPGAPVTFTGRAVGRAKAGVVGEVGDLAYAIQGNVLSGEVVVRAAESALLGTPGDLSQKLLAAMQAARDMGGDGRCSCDFSDPIGCGAPPDDFDKSAHVGFLLVTRVGDDVPPCRNGSDCADGDFYLRLNVRGADANENDPDPVDQLTQRYASWRNMRRGRPDGILSEVDAVDSLPADGRAQRNVTVQLVDLDGVPLTRGGAKVRVAQFGRARLNTSIGPVLDLGDGRYRFSIRALETVGSDRYVITAEDGLLEATLFPFFEVRTEPPAALHVGVDELSAAKGGVAPFVLDQPAFAGGAYLLLASASGTSPGIPLGRIGWLPLVRDPLFDLSLRRAGDPAIFARTRGALDTSGRAEAEFVAPPGALAALIGRRLSWAAVLVNGARGATTAAVGFEVGP